MQHSFIAKITEVNILLYNSHCYINSIFLPINDLTKLYAHAVLFGVQYILSQKNDNHQNHHSFV